MRSDGRHRVLGRLVTRVAEQSGMTDEDNAVHADSLCRCQLITGGAGGREPWAWFLRRQSKRGVKALGRLPGYVLRRSKGAVRRSRRMYLRLWGGDTTAADATLALRTPRPTGESCAGLRPGSRVRVRSREEIERTLDRRRRYHGCPFAEPMFQYCGQEFRVFKCVDRFFDEAQWRLLKCRNVVLLEGVLCDGSGYPDSQGCDRSCFYFWRTEWLEPVDGSAR